MSRRTSKKDREEFVAVLTRECPAIDPVRVARIAGRIMRYGATMGRLAEEECNGDWPIRKVNQDEWRKLLDKRKLHAANGVLTACWELAANKELKIKPVFGSDPRGFTVKLLLPSGRYNTWGGREDGWGVPTS